jgi:hypothetical protein
MSRPADRARRFIGRLPNKHSTHLGNTPPASKSPIASDARPRHTSRGFLVWGFFCQGVRQSGKSFVLRQFLCSISKPVSSSRPRALTSSRAGAVKVGRRPNVAACSELTRPYLDSFEHDDTLGAIGMTIRGGARLRTRDQSRHNLVSGGSKDPNHDAVIRIGSEAPKRRTHSPFRH